MTKRISKRGGIGAAFDDYLKGEGTYEATQAVAIKRVLAWQIEQAMREKDIKRPRISIDVEPEIRRRLRLAAARRDLTVRRYILEAIEERLQEDLGDERNAVLGLTAKADPVLADLWDNRRDAEYDRL